MLDDKPRRGRKPLPPELRREPVMIRVNAAERARLHQQAEAAGLPVAAYIRKKLKL